MYRGSSSKYAILGVLTLGPHTGYDIKKFIGQSIAHFWRESYGNIYPILKRLAENGLVRRKLEKQKGKPNRQVYTITEKGRVEFQSWLGEPFADEHLRSELLLKLFFGTQVPLETTIAHLRDCRARQENLLKVYREAQKSLPEIHKGNPNLPFWLMTLRRGMLVAQARLRWAKEFLAEFSTEVRTTDRRK